jgi:hypothetical protein
MPIRSFTAAITLVIGLLYASVATSADIRTVSLGSYQKVLIEGPIAAGDFEKFIAVIKENKGAVIGVNIFSSGGDFYEAMKIGRAMRALELSSQVPMKSISGQPVCDDQFGMTPNDPMNCTCASAGFFIHIGATHRGGTYLAVHRPFFAKGRYGELSQANAQKAFNALQSSARIYMEEMGVPKHVQEDVLGTPSDRILVLDDKTVKTYFWMELPYLHEWKQNQCSDLSVSEKKRADLYFNRITQSGVSLTSEERSDWQDLRKRQDQELKCESKIEARSRLDAYARYFSPKSKTSR